MFSTSNTSHLRLDTFLVSENNQWGMGGRRGTMLDGRTLSSQLPFQRTAGDYSELVAPMPPASHSLPGVQECSLLLFPTWAHAGYQRELPQGHPSHREPPMGHSVTIVACPEPNIQPLPTREESKTSNFGPKWNSSVWEGGISNMGKAAAHQ